jgi:hypothetical protein
VGLFWGLSVFFPAGSLALIIVQQEGPLIGILQQALVIVIQPAIQRWGRGDREAAAVGVVLFFVGALITHLRAHDSSLAPATVFLLLAVTTLALGLAT